MAFIKNTRVNKYCQGYGEIGTCTLLMGMSIGIATREIHMDVPLKIKNRTSMWSSNPTFEYISKGYEDIKTDYWYLHSHVHHSIIHNSQDMETT